MIIIILVIVFGYVLPAYLGYRYFHIAYSKGGIWENTDPTFIDVIVIFIPLFNLFFVLFLAAFDSPKKKTKRNLNNFLKIKK